MARLYCEEHGREHEARVIGNQHIYREAGESVLIVHGKLKSGPWHCDQCYGKLRRGHAAYLATAFPPHMTAGFDEYDFRYERRYFRLEGEETLTVYGKVWPDVTEAQRREDEWLYRPQL